MKFHPDGELHRQLIYIPLWIDLNFQISSSQLQPHYYLHSTMDRFKCKECPEYSAKMKDLHSTMDRFKS